MPVNQAMILWKAKTPFQLLKDKDDDISNYEILITSNGWFCRFWKKFDWHNIWVQGQAASANMEAVKDFLQHLAEIIENKALAFNGLFSADKISHHWQKMPLRAYTVKEVYAGIQSSKRSTNFAAEAVPSPFAFIW